MTSTAPIVAVAIRRARSFQQSEIDPKALEKNRAEERADHARQCIAYEAAAADEPTREPPRDEPNPDLRGKSLLVDFRNRIPVNDHAHRQARA